MTLPGQTTGVAVFFDPLAADLNLTRLPVRPCVRDRKAGDPKLTAPAMLAIELKALVFVYAPSGRRMERFSGTR
jgi:hypothetical protein